MEQILITNSTQVKRIKFIEKLHTKDILNRKTTNVTLQGREKFENHMKPYQILTG